MGQKQSIGGAYIKARSAQQKGKGRHGEIRMRSAHKSHLLEF